MNKSLYNDDAADLQSCPCGLSILVEALGGFESGLLPPMLTESMFHAFWTMDFFQHALHPLADDDLCLILRTFMGSDKRKLADATAARFGLLMTTPEDMRTYLTAAVTKIPAIVEDVVRKWGERELLAVGATQGSRTSRVVIVDLSKEGKGGLEDLMLYQALIDTYLDPSADTLWLTKEACDGGGVRFGLRRAGETIDCGAIADDLQLFFGGADISAGGHPYAAVAKTTAAKVDTVQAKLLDKMHATNEFHEAPSSENQKTEEVEVATMALA